MPRHQLHLDANSPSIIVPITATDLAQLQRQAGALADNPVIDLVEWRVDLYEPFLTGATSTSASAGQDPGPAVAALETLTGLLPDVPVLATFRTPDEGGSAEISGRDYVALITALSATGLAAAVDVEYLHPWAAHAIEAAHAHGVAVVASNHDFEATPPLEDIVERLAAMEVAGADVAKIAVMPRSAADVVTLIAATESRHRTAGIPLITMSMGALGAVTRLGGGTFGSAATFATVGEASAPGQLPAAAVRTVLDLLGSGSGGPSGPIDTAGR